MSTYSILLRILDRIREESPAELLTYRPDHSEVQKINQARAKAYIHLYLKANLGILDFKTREDFITDGPQDGGIDGYYIDNQAKAIYFIQSKFRTTETNFQEKQIQLDEILRMDIDRILNGETAHENGVPYNDKILEMQTRIRSISDIARYKYEVVILANLSKITDSKLRILTSGFPAKLYDYKKTYSDLVFPIISGTYYNYSDLNINVNLSNRSAGAKINYSVETQLGICDITVLFAPLSEIGKLMYQYKNSILKYNPRSYLTLKEGTINDDIRQTVLKKSTNEFALFNNGITILSDETFFNERIGQKDKAQLSLKNPQIINGGQTAYTLGLIYEDSLTKDPTLKGKLEGKEVLLRVITFNPSHEIPLDKKLELIEAVSEASNKQTQVNNADRSSNDPLLVDTQKILFTDFGVLLERKRGEFFDGLRYGYLEKANLIDRGVFMRIALSCLGYPRPPKKHKQLFSQDKISLILNDTSNIGKYFFGCLLYSEILNWPNKRSIGQASLSGMFAVISVCVAKYYNGDLNDLKLKEVSKAAVASVLNSWMSFEDYAMNQMYNSPYFTFNFNYKTQSYRVTSNYRGYYMSQFLTVDLNDFFFSGESKLNEDSGTRKNLVTLERFLESRHLNPDIIRSVQPMINPDNWFDEGVKKEMSSKFCLDSGTVNRAIRAITSRETGYYVSRYYRNK